MRCNSHTTIIMKKHIIFSVVCSFLSLTCFSATLLWQADFESPDYSLGAIVGQQGWVEFSSGFGSGGQIVNNIPGDVIPEGAQCLHLPPPGENNYVMVRTPLITNELAAVDISNEFVRISYKMRPDTTYDALDIYPPSGSPRMLLMPVYPDGLKIQVPVQSEAIPCTYAEWHDIFLILDPLNSKAVQFGLNGVSMPIDIPFNDNQKWPIGFLRFSSQVTSPAPEGSGTGQCYVDDVKVEAIPAGPILGANPPRMFIGTFSQSGAARIVNSGRPAPFSWEVTATAPWITVDPAYISGSTTEMQVSLPFAVDKSDLPVGDTVGTIEVDCDEFGILIFTVTARKGDIASSIINVAGLHVTALVNRGGGDRYYQDTMIENRTPRANFDGGQMDIAVIRGFYDFDLPVLQGDEYAAPFLISGPPQYVNKGAVLTNRPILALDQNHYDILNPVFDNTTDPTVLGGLSEYIPAAELTKQDLNMPLYEGTNQFTLILADAGEIGSQGLIGLFLYGTNGPNFVDGDLPTLVAVDDGSGMLDADGYYPMGFFNGDRGYFQFPLDTMLIGDTHITEMEGNLIRVTHFNVVGRNDTDINEYGLSGPGCVGYVTEPGVEQGWAIRSGGNQAIAFLEIVVGQPPPQPAAATPIVGVEAWNDGATVRVINNGGGSFNYTATTDVAWLTIDPAFVESNVVRSLTIPFTVDRSTLSEGFHTATIALACDDPEETDVLFTVIVRVAMPGVVHVHGLHVTQLDPNQNNDKYYQDTMIASRTPAPTFNAAMDIGVLRDFYCFGIEIDDPRVEPYLEDFDIPAQMLNKGAFYNSVIVYALDQNVYPILNPVLDNDTNPVVSGDVNAYISSAELYKETLAMSLDEGTNRFTLLMASAVEIANQGMIGLFLYEPGTTPAFVPGEMPTIAAVDDNSGYLNADGFFSCGYVEGDAGYWQKATNMFDIGSDTLTGEVGMYYVTITHFNVARPNDPAVNPYGMTSPSAVGYVCDTFTNQWPILPAGSHAIGYLEMYVELIPEPALFTFLVGALGFLLLRRR